MTVSETHKKKLVRLLLTAQVGILVLLFCVFICRRESLKGSSVEVCLADWRSESAVYDLSGWYVSQDMCRSSSSKSQEPVLKSPPLSLRAGYYTVRVDYDCTDDQTFTVQGSGQEAYLIEAGPFILDKTAHTASYRFRVGAPIKKLYLSADFNQNGSLRIQNVLLQPSALGWLHLTLLAMVFFALIDLIYIFRKAVSAHRATVLQLLFCIGLASLPLFSSGLHTGHDIGFHLRRIEGIAAALRQGVFPVRMSSLWLHGYGYPVSVYYGDILLYIPAVLRLASVPVLTCYKIYVLCIHLLTAVISFSCFRKIFRSEGLAALLTAAYTLSSYRLVTTYIRAACGEYSAMAFLPLLALALHRMYVQQPLSENDALIKAAAGSEGCRKTVAANAAILVTGMTGILQTHLLSAEMVAVIFILFCVLNWRKTLQKTVLLTWGLGAAWTILLNAWFLVPFLDYMSHVSVRINTLMDGAQTYSFLGASLLQYFSFFQNPFGGASPELSESMALSPGLLLMAGLIAAAFLIIKQRRGQVFLWHFGLSIFLLFAASNLFPWNLIGQGGWIGSLLTQIQYPWRYLELSLLTLSLLLGDVVQILDSELSRQLRLFLRMTLLGTLLVSSASFMGNYADHSSILRIYDTAELDFSKISGGEYLLSDVSLSQKDALPLEAEGTGMQTVSVESRSGTSWSIHCTAGESGGSVILPLFSYPNYQITDDTGVRIPLHDDGHGRICFFLPPDYDGILKLAYVPPLSWRAAEVISFLTLAGSLLWVFLRLRRLSSCHKQPE